MFDMLLHFIQTSFKINFILVKISFFKLKCQSGMDTVKSGMRKRPPFSRTIPGNPERLATMYLGEMGHVTQIIEVYSETIPTDEIHPR